MPTVLVTGANRGIGLELARQYAEDEWRVLATCREPGAAAELGALAEAHDALTVHALDVTDFDAVDALAETLAGEPIDVLLNNAGVYGPDRRDGSGGQDFGSLDYEAMTAVIRTNSLAPLKMAEAFHRHVAASDQRRIVAITSTMGSISDGGEGSYAYRVSKAALNMAMATLAREQSASGFRVAVLNPGWVRTDMGGESASLTPEESVRGLRRVIANLDDRRSGGFFNYDGERIDW